jgi:hypothetical protein
MSFVGLLASAVSTAARQAESLSSEETAQKFRSAFAETMMAGMNLSVHCSTTNRWNKLL